MGAPESNHVNAVLNHAWGNFGWNFAPRLGNIGLSVLEPFETIIDYTHQRVVLIRLDSAGHRLANVPAYTPKWSAPIIDTALYTNDPQWQFWGVATRADYTLDTLDASKNTVIHALDTGSPTNDAGLGLLGYPFLRPLGVVGFNHRNGDTILYRSQPHN